MLEFVQAVVGLQRIGEERGTSFNVLADFGLKRILLTVWHYSRTSIFSATFQNARLTAVLSLPPVPVILRARFSGCMFRALPPMKVSSASISPATTSHGQNRYP